MVGSKFGKKCFYAVIFMIFGVLLIVLYSSSFSSKTVEIITGTDLNGNRIHDALENRLKNGTAKLVLKEGKELLDLIVCFDRSPIATDRSEVYAFGGDIKNVWKDSIYGMNILISPKDLDKYLQNNPHILFIEENAQLKATLELSTRQIRAREVWAGNGLPSGYSGNSAHRVAILDTGLDSSHPDLDMALWMDFVISDPAPSSGWDKNHHGTHVAGIATGKGTSAGLSNFPITFARSLYTTAGIGYIDYYPVSIGSTPKSITGKMKWVAGGTGYLDLRNSSNGVMGSNSGSSPISTISYATSNVFNGAFRLLAAGLTTPPAGTTAFVQVTTAYDAWGDGFNLVRGVAPNTQSVGLRVLGDSGSGSFADYISACNWLVSSCAINNIVVANASLGASYQDLGGRSSSVESATNSAVNAGCTMVIAAGNDQNINENIGEPGYSSHAITIAAVSDLNRLTNYSSLGVSTETIIKPDVTSPGGSNVTRNAITSTDSNDADEITNFNNPFAPSVYTTDQYPNDYITLQGTSMASPHVAGLVALIADAKGTWNFGSNTDPFFAKNIILLTAWESPQGESAVPTLNRGVKDLREGYGRVNADACIEAVVLSYSIGSAETATLGSTDTAKKVWARKVLLSASVSTITLTVPGGTDFDLYLYRFNPDSVGDPVILSRSTTAGTGGTEQVIYSSPSSQMAYIVVKQVSGSGTFTLNSQDGLISPNPPILVNIPSLKLFVNQSLNNAFDLEDYNTGDIGTTYIDVIDFNGLTSLTGSVVDQASFGSVTVGDNSYAITNAIGSSTAGNKVKYTTYKTDVPDEANVYLTAGDIKDVTISASSSGSPATPPSFGNTDSIIVSNLALVTATWSGTTGIQITALSGFTAGVTPVTVDVIASPLSASPFGTDIDKERINVYPIISPVTYRFSNSSDTTIFGYEATPGRATIVTPAYNANMADSVGESANGVLTFTFANNQGGVKATPNLSNRVSYQAGEWYIIRTRVTGDSGNSHQTLLFNFSNEVAVGGHVDVSATVLLGSPTTWTWVEAPLYSYETGIGYPQIQLKAGGTGSLSIDEIQIVKAAPWLVNGARGNIRSKYAGGDFNTGSDSNLWGKQGYSITSSGFVIDSPQATTNVTSGVLSVNFSGAGSGTNQKGIKWTASTTGGGTGIVTPASVVGKQVGVKADVSKSSGSFNSLSSVILLGAFGAQSNGGSVLVNGTELLASAEFGRITDGTHYLIANGTNGFHQFQFGSKNDQNGILEIDNVDFISDPANPNYGDPILYP